MRPRAECNPVVLNGIPLDREIVRDEQWLEGQRRGYIGPADDPTVRDWVCLAIMRIGAQMRAAIRTDLQHRVESAGPQGRESVDATTRVDGLPGTS